MIPCVSPSTTHFQLMLRQNFLWDLTDSYFFFFMVLSHSTIDPNHNFIEVSFNKVPNKFHFDRLPCQNSVLSFTSNLTWLILWIMFIFLKIPSFLGSSDFWFSFCHRFILISLLWQKSRSHFLFHSFLPTQYLIYPKFGRHYHNIHPEPNSFSPSYCYSCRSSQYCLSPGVLNQIWSLLLPSSLNPFKSVSTKQPW